jgi:hypothetical protein
MNELKTLELDDQELMGVVGGGGCERSCGCEGGGGIAVAIAVAAAVAIAF